VVGWTFRAMSSPTDTVEVRERFRRSVAFAILSESFAAAGFSDGLRMTALVFSEIFEGVVGSGVL
jgi:hypothetical protein